MPATTALRPLAPLEPLGAANARWASGFWGDDRDRTRDVTSRGMWDSLRDPAVSPGLRNFRIAAGLEDGVHTGPPFMDGDLYKWLEAAIAELETRPRPRARRDASRRSPRSSPRCSATTATSTRPPSSQRATSEDARRPGRPLPLRDVQPRAPHHRRRPPLRGHRQHDAAGRRAQGGRLPRGPRDEQAGRARAQRDLPVALHGRRSTCTARPATSSTSASRRRSCASATTSKAATTTRTASRCGSRRSSPATRCAPTTSTPGSPTSSPRRATTSCAACSRTCGRDVVDTKLYITGGCGALYDGASPDGYPWQDEISRIHQAYGRAYQLPHTTAHSESCANIGMILWSERMLALTGDARYADVIEQIAFNALLAGISLDGTAVLLHERAPPGARPALPAAHARRHRAAPGARAAAHPTNASAQPYLSCFCCPPNIARTLARFHERAASVSPDGLYVHQYGGSDIALLPADGRSPRAARVQRLPLGRAHRVHRRRRRPGGGIPLHLRVPGWSTAPRSP